MKSLTTILIITVLNTTAMAMEITTEIIINASPEKVWAILTDFNNYPNWNPFIKSLEGDVKVGNKISAYIEPPETKGMTFKPKILVFEPNKEFRWVGHLLLPGLFDGKHRFELIDNGDGTTTFRQSEIFKGILVPFFKKQLNDNTRRGFIAMNEQLKILAEKN